MDAPIDAGVQELVQLLSQIQGVTTRASCEGGGGPHGAHRHAATAYVACRQPLPLRLQEFLRAQVGTLARLEDDGLYSRWPEQNRAFVASTLAALRLYLAQRVSQGRIQLRWPLPRVRARLARALSANRSFCVGLCLQCGELHFEPHYAGHRALVLLRCEPDIHSAWFAEFVQQPRNALDPALIASDGWNNLLARTRHGDFGLAFQRRWLRYRARRLAELATRSIRTGVADARGDRPDLDCFYTDTQLVLEWNRDGERTG